MSDIITDQGIGKAERLAVRAARENRKERGAKWKNTGRKKQENQAARVRGIAEYVPFLLPISMLKFKQH